MPATIPAYNLHDFRTLAKKRLPKGIFEYIDRGVEDEVALAENRADAFKPKRSEKYRLSCSKEE